MWGFLARMLRRRSEPAAEEEGPDPRAEELRRRLEEAKPLVEEREQEAFEAGETTVDAVEPEQEPEPEREPEPQDPDAKRRAVHERARAAIDEMGGGGGEPTPPA